MLEIGIITVHTGAPARICERIMLEIEQDMSNKLFWHALCFSPDKNFAVSGAPSLRNRIPA
jgi:hypothetical protein